MGNNRAMYAIYQGLFVVMTLLAACGRTVLTTTDGGFGDGDLDGSIKSSCGDGTCSDSEDCTSCPVDCGLCETCGDLLCSDTETCDSCPGDCGTCDPCGDGFCLPEDGEDCLSCAPDCGICPACGDASCDAFTEDCFTCPDDCGACAGCGDGQCEGTENCASCQRDCGVCDFCGNGVCETEDFETCSTCSEDCGVCPVRTCFEVFNCSLGCIDFDTGLFSFSCLSACNSGCADAEFFLDQAIQCAINVFFNGGDLTDLGIECASELAACFGATC
ncbi:MAG: hypothetical protein AAF355_13695 [Myxococcota bacterium]